MKKGKFMRNLVGVIGLMLVGSLVGCGQPGALQLTSDPNLDKRPKYLLWHHKQSAKQTDPATSQSVSEPSTTQKD